jgi:hypothetical protein
MIFTFPERPPDEFLRDQGQIKDQQKEEAPISLAPAEDLLRAVAGAAKLKRLWLQVRQFFNPARLVARLSIAVGATAHQSHGESNDHRKKKMLNLPRGRARVCSRLGRTAADIGSLKMKRVPVAGYWLIVMRHYGSFARRTDIGPRSL